MHYVASAHSLACPVATRGHTLASGGRAELREALQLLGIPLDQDLVQQRKWHGHKGSKGDAAPARSWTS